MKTHPINLLQFPKTATLSTCLEKHPRTNNPDYTEMKITEAISNYFGNTRRLPIGVGLGTLSIINTLNSSKLNLKDREVMTIENNYLKALNDCIMKN